VAMKIKRNSKSNINARNVRQRLERPTHSKLNSAYSYSSRRSGDKLNIGRSVESANLEAVNKDKRTTVNRLWPTLILITFLLISFFLLKLSPNPALIYPQADSNLVTPQEKAKYEAAADKLLSKSFLASNKLTLDVGSISASLVKEFPEIQSVSVTTSMFSSTPKIYIQPAQPSLLLVEADGTYVIDNNGRAMSKDSPNNVGSTSGLTLVKDESNLNVELGQRVLPTTSISFVETVVGELTAKGYKIASIDLPAQSAELDVSLAGESYYIKFNLETNDPRQQTGTFIATINELKSQNITPSKYVDVRLDGRAYYQ
jgi:hypothetical protein